KVLRGDVISPIPLLFDLSALVAEDLRHPRDDLRDERMGLLDGLSRLVDESSLYRLPAAAITLRFLVGKQHGMPIIRDGCRGRSGSARWMSLRVTIAGLRSFPIAAKLYIQWRLRSLGSSGIGNVAGG